MTTVMFLTFDFKKELKYNMYRRINLKTEVASLPSHLLGRWTQSSSPTVVFVAPIDHIVKKNDRYAIKIISSTLSDSLSNYNSRFVL